MSAGASHHRHEIVRVPDKAVGSQTFASSLLTSACPFAHLCPCLGEVLVQNRERDVTEQRRKYPPLRGASDRVPLHAILTKDAGFEKRLHQSQNALVSNSFSHPIHQGRVVDFVEACLDVSLNNPLIGAGAEVVNLSNSVLSPASRAEAVTARLEVRLEDRLEHQLECSLHHPIPHGRDPQPTALAAGFGNHPLAHGEWAERPFLQLGPEIGEEPFLAQFGSDVIGALPIHARRASPSIAPDTLPGHQQDGRVAYEVVEVVEPTRWVV